MKKVLILGGAGVHCKLVEAAHEMNLCVIVADYLKKDDSPAKQIADKNYEVDINDIDGIIQICIEESVDAVLTTHLDPCQKPYQKICEKLGFPCMGTEEQFEYLTNKRKFKMLCQESGVDIIPGYTVADVYDDRVNYPVFIKPVDSRGSRGQKKCENRRQALEAIESAQKESSDGDCIIEKYLGDEDEIQITYFFENGNAHLIRTADSYRGEGKLRNIVTHSVSPSKYTTEFRNTTNEKIIKMLKKIGIKNGPVMMQGFYDNGVFRFFDPGLRFPGVEYERIYKKMYNIDFLKLIIEYSLTGSMPQIDIDESSVYLEGKRAEIVFPLISEGIIAKIEGLDKIEQNEKVISVLHRHREKDTISWSYDINQRLCEIDMLFDKNEKLNERERILSELKVYNNKGKNMLLFYR